MFQLLFLPQAVIGFFKIRPFIAHIWVFRQNVKFLEPNKCSFYIPRPVREQIERNVVIVKSIPELTVRQELVHRHKHTHTDDGSAFKKDDIMDGLPLRKRALKKILPDKSERCFARPSY